MMMEIIGVETLGNSNLVPDKRVLEFKEEAKRQSTAVAAADQQDDVMEFIDATLGFDEIEALV